MIKGTYVLLMELASRHAVDWSVGQRPAISAFVKVICSDTINASRHTEKAWMKGYSDVDLKRWLDKGWRRLANGHGHPLSVIGSERLDGRDVVVLLGPRNRFGAEYFQVFVANEDPDSVVRQAIVGLHSAGPHPAHNWVEIMCFGDDVHASPTGDGAAAGDSTCLELLRRVAGVIPPGGHFMVEYDSPGQRETARALALGVPPPATQLGFLMHLVGCGATFRDWYFAEGGSEGPRKLQGSKPLNREHADRASRELAHALVEFLESPVDPEKMDTQRSARKRAAWILSNAQVEGIHLRRRIRKVLASHADVRGKG